MTLAVAKISLRVCLTFLVIVWAGGGGCRRLGMDGDGPVCWLGAELGVICGCAGEGVEGAEDGLVDVLGRGIGAADVG